ncbi:MAG: sigma-70 family RNA polymerase sigma factor [Oscillospiraceae bacterium]|nr:sigma-70 family RNA polymerase sigma factor [Oscillospiraceae bacterium]
MADLKDFSSLVDLYYAKVFYHCVKTIKNNHDSADITQNTFTKAFINIKNLKQIDSFDAWIFTICNNEIKLFYRNKNKNISNSLCFDIENISSKPDNIKKYDNLYSAIDILEDKYKNLVILKYFAEFTVKEIATLTKINEKLVKSRLYDARKKLENLLSESEKSASSLNIYNLNQERKKEIMSTAKLIELGIHVVSRMSANGLNSLLKCAKNNEKFSSEVLSELAKVEQGSEFTVECGGKLSYDEYIQILSGCDWGVLYEFEDTHNVMRDVAAYLGTGGYIESVETVLYVQSVPDTVNWYKKYLGWDGGGEDTGHDIVHVFKNEGYPYRGGTSFHLRKAGENSPVTKCSFFIIVSNRQLELIRERIIKAGWDKISDIHDSGFGAIRFIVEDLNGVGLEFLEWRN